MAYNGSTGTIPPGGCYENLVREVENALYQGNCLRNRIDRTSLCFLASGSVCRRNSVIVFPDLQMEMTPVCAGHA